MNPLLLSGYGVKIRVQNLKTSSELEVTDGRKDGEESKTMRFRPRHFPYSSVLVEGKSGYISLQAFHWLAKNNVPVFLTQFDGSIISSLLPPTPIKADLRSAIRPSFVFDLQEPFRWLIDYVVMQMFGQGQLGISDFFFTGNDYRYRFMPEAKQRFINRLRVQFNKHACSEGTLDWAEVIKGRAAAFGRFLTERSEKLDFTEPSPILSNATGVEGS